MGVLFKHYLTGSEVYVCTACKTHFTLPNLLISKAFNGANGKAYLFKRVVNVDEGHPEERDLLTGKHIVCDVTCVQCKCYIGWKYIKAFPKDQEYKTGSYVLERTFIILVKQDESKFDSHNSSTITYIEDFEQANMTNIHSISDNDAAYHTINNNVDDLAISSQNTQPSDIDDRYDPSEQDTLHESDQDGDWIVRI